MLSTHHEIPLYQPLQFSRDQQCINQSSQLHLQARKQNIRNGWCVTCINHHHVAVLYFTGLQDNDNDSILPRCINIINVRYRPKIARVIKYPDNFNPIEASMVCIKSKHKLFVVAALKESDNEIKHRLYRIDTISHKWKPLQYNIFESRTNWKLLKPTNFKLKSLLKLCCTKDEKLYLIAGLINSDHYKQHVLEDKSILMHETIYIYQYDTIAEQFMNQINTKFIITNCHVPYTVVSIHGTNAFLLIDRWFMTAAVLFTTGLQAKDVKFVNNPISSSSSSQQTADAALGCRTFKVIQNSIFCTRASHSKKRREAYRNPFTEFTASIHQDVSNNNHSFRRMSVDINFNTIFSACDGIVNVQGNIIIAINGIDMYVIAINGIDKKNTYRIKRKSSDELLADPFYNLMSPSGPKDSSYIGTTETILMDDEYHKNQLTYKFCRDNTRIYGIQELSDYVIKIIIKYLFIEYLIRITKKEIFGVDRIYCQEFPLSNKIFN